MEIKKRNEVIDNFLGGFCLSLGYTMFAESPLFFPAQGYVFTVEIPDVYRSFFLAIYFCRLAENVIPWEMKK